MLPDQRMDARINRLTTLDPRKCDRNFLDVKANKTPLFWE